MRSALAFVAGAVVGATACNLWWNWLALQAGRQEDEIDSVVEAEFEDGMEQIEEFLSSLP